MAAASTSVLAHQVAGRGRTVLLVHGFPFERSMWAPQIAALQHGQRVLAPDLRGFGASAFPRGAAPDVWTMEQHADDLAALLDALGEREPVVLVGFSMGGYVAWPFVRKHRRRLAGLVLCDTRAAADAPEGARGRLALAQRVLEEGPEPVVEAMLPKLLAPRTLAERPEVVARVQGWMRAAPREGIAAALRGMAARADSSTLLASIDLPTLVVVGAHDAISPPAEMHAIARAIPGARAQEIADAGHMTTVEAPSALSALLGEFLASLC